MEIKTTLEIYLEDFKINGDIKWVKVDDIIQFIKDNNKPFIEGNTILTRLFNELTKSTDFEHQRRNFDVSQSNPSTHNKAIVTEKLSNPLEKLNLDNSVSGTTEGRDTLEYPRICSCGKKLLSKEAYFIHRKEEIGF